MDVKDLRTESALSERNNDGSKYTQGGIATLQCNRNKSYQDIGSNPLAKAEGALVRPCAVIGPDRVVPPPAASDAFLKKGAVEPWPSPDNGYRRPPDYPHRINQNPARNISPRQTFQENMQRINVPPTYNAVRHSDSANFNHIQDRSVTISKNAKPNMAPEAKYCDVPYPMNALVNEPKNVRDSEIYVSSVNSQLTRSAPHVWPTGSVNVNAPRTYSANEPYQYPQYSSCAGQRPPVMPATRPLRTIQEDPAYVYPDHYYRDAIGRLKPYPPMKERCPQPRYEHVGNYAGQFHPPPTMQPHKYDIPKPNPSHPYPMFPHFKYLDNRVPDLTLEGYQRSTSHQPHYNLPLRTQVIHPTYAQMPGNTPQKMQPFPPDGSVRAIPPNKLHYDNSSKMYIDYENARTKPYPMGDNYYVNEMNRYHPLKNQMVIPNFSPVGMRAMPSQQYYLKDNPQMKPFEYMPTFRNFEPHLTGNPVLRHAPQFSPNTLAISPTDSSTSNDTSQTHVTSQEDCGYVSQSSTTSARSIDSGIYRLPHEYYKRHDFRYGPIVGNSHPLANTDLNPKDSKQKQINVRQFLQMWNEGEEENNAENNNSKDIIEKGSSETGNLPKHANTEDQLYVLGLVNVPSEELGKYEHIEKISKLPENIKGYNNLELFSRFEEAMESCNTAFKTIPKEFQNSLKNHSTKLLGESLSRPVSPLDVESKISQSVIHKEVGCNFEIKPCSPKMLNVEIAAPVQNILAERVIEKVSNPLSKIVKSPLPIKSDENTNCHTVLRQDNGFAIADNPSCKMIRSPFSSNNMDSVKTNYTLQDLEINSGVCLASLPQLDNEIELNFPEVNQQFINANKRDGFSTANNFHQSYLQEGLSLPDNKEDKSDSEKCKIMPTESDKSLNKLSKYRKTKTSVTDSSENKSKAVRTDSVIIKNPENIENKMLENSLNIPINLSSQPAQWYDSPHEPNENKDSDIALDFSLNKSGNDLPIIETDRDVPNKPFEINHLRISRENTLPIDSNASYHESAYINDITANSKTSAESIQINSSNVPCIQNYQDISCRNVLNVLPTELSKQGIVECTQPDPKTASEVQTNQEVENKLDVKPYEVIKSAVKVKDTGAPVSHSLHSDSLVFENTLLEDKNYNIDQPAHADEYKRDLHKIHGTCKNITTPESQASGKIFKKCENTLISNDNNDNDKSNLEKDFDNCEHFTTTHKKTVRNNESEHIKQFFNAERYSKVNKSALLITSQNENDFEHDEISASLEKLFRENNEETSPKNDNCSSSVSVFKSLQKNGCHQSKELFSPWIQKLLLHSEGSCSYNEFSQKVLVKSIFDPDEYTNKPTQSGTRPLKEELAQAIHFNHNETIDSALLVKPNKYIKDLTLDIRPKLESNTTMSTDSIKNMNVFDKKENDLQNTTKTLIEKHKIVDVNQLCIEKTSQQITNDKRNKTQVDFHTSKRKFKKRKLGKISKLAKKLSTCDSECSSNVSVSRKIDTNNVENNLTENESETITNRTSSCDLQSIIKKDLTLASSKCVPVTLSHDKENQITEEYGTKQDSIEIAITNHNSNTDAVSEMNNSSNTDLKINATVQDNLNELNIKKILDDDTNDRTLLKKQNNLSSESLFESVSDIHSEHQKQEQFIDEGIISNMVTNNIANINNILETSNSGSIDQDDQNISGELHCSVIDKCTVHETKESKSLQSLPDSLSVDNFISYQAKNNQTEKESIKKRNSIEESKEGLDESECINTICDHKVVNQDNQISCSSKSSVSNQNKEFLTEEVSEISNTHQISNSLDSLEVICTDKDIIQKQKKNSDSNTDNLNKNVAEKSFDDNNFNDSKKYKGHVITETFDHANVVCKQDDCQDQDQHNIASEILSSSSVDNSIRCVIPENGKNIIENIIEDVAEVKNNLSANTFDTTNIQSGYKYQESQHHVDIALKNSYSYINNETDKPNILDCLVTNCLIDTKVTSEVCTKIAEIDYISNEHISNSNLESCPMNDKPKPETIDKLEEKSCTKNKFESKDSDIHINSSVEACEPDNIIHENESNSLTNIHIGISAEECDSRSESDNVIQENESNSFTNIHIGVSAEECDSKSEPNNVIQENKSNSLTNLSDSESGQCIKENNQQITLSDKDDFILTGGKSCEDKDNQSDPYIENNFLELMSKIHNPKTSIQESPMKRRLTLKRSFSDSALNSLKNRDTPDRQLIDNTPMWPPKRQKIFEFDDTEQQVIDENFCNFIQNRRNSISSYYNAENVSFCILIDNDCILTEENEGDKICFAELSEDIITEVNTADVEDTVSEVICGPDENDIDYSDPVMLGYDSEKSDQESWLDDVACVETVVSDDILEDADNVAPDFSGDATSNYDESGIFNSDMSVITHEVDVVNEEIVHDDVSEFENTYISPCGDDKIMLYDEEPQYTDNYNALYSGQCLEKILSESYCRRCSPTSDYTESISLPGDTADPKLPEDKENIFVKNMSMQNCENDSDHNGTKLPEDKENIFVKNISMQNCENDSDHNGTDRSTAANNFNESVYVTKTSCSIQHSNLPESSVDNVFSYKKGDDDVSYTASSSSPEVSSTTFEEKSSSILLKITNYNGSRVSEVNEVNHNRPRCKFTESKDYSNLQGCFPKRPLITKAAQKYIPPLKESIRDLKVKLPLPQQRLLKLKQLKLSRNEPKVTKQNVLTTPKKQKPKPNFEDVLKNIDEVQIKMHKQNNKKIKNVIPKVVIKKNGSHYTSSSSNDKFNPDLTGRKWQPWVFLERSHFIDIMAMENKTKAIYSHRKNTYVLAERFKKYKSINNCSAKFVISQPKTGDSSKGQLKYTIRLKHIK